MLRYSLRPSPPDLLEQRVYFKSDPRAYLFWLSAVRLAALFGTWLFICSTKSWWLVPYAAIAVLYAILYLSYGLTSRPFDFNEHYRFCRRGVSSLPEIDVFIPTCGEDTATVLNTISHALQLIYPGRSTVWVLDDGDDAALKAHLPASDRLRYVVRPNRPEGRKGGNLNYALTQATGELVAIFDADFAPASNFLLETVPYFQDPRLAILQTPQWFRVQNQESAIAKGAVFCQEIFYRFVQVARSATGSAGCVGTNLIYRRSAIDSIGGTAIVEASEDRYTAWRMQKIGWKIHYIPVCLAAGLGPPTVSALYCQSYRWANGSTIQFFSREFWAECPLWHRRSQMSLMNWLSYLLSSMFFILEALSVCFGSLPILYMFAFHAESANWMNSAVFIPSLVLLRLVNPALCKARWTYGVMWAGTISSYAFLASVLSVLQRRQFKWVATGNSGATSSATIVKRFWRFYPAWVAFQTTAVLGFAWNAIQDGYPACNFLLGSLLSAINASTMLSLVWSERVNVNLDSIGACFEDFFSGCLKLFRDRAK